MSLKTELYVAGIRFQDCIIRASNGLCHCARKYNHAERTTCKRASTLNRAVFYRCMLTRLAFSFSLSFYVFRSLSDGSADRHLMYYWKFHWQLKITLWILLHQKKILLSVFLCSAFLVGVMLSDHHHARGVCSRGFFCRILQNISNPQPLLSNIFIEYSL